MRENHAFLWIWISTLVMGNANAIPCVTLLTQICILRYVSALPALPVLTHVLTQIALPVLTQIALPVLTQIALPVGTVPGSVQ